MIPKRFVSQLGLVFVALTLLFSHRLPALPIRKPLRTLTTQQGLPQSFVSGLVQDNQGFVWVATRNGLARYDGRQFIAFHYKQGDSRTLSSDVIVHTLKDRQGQIWIENESGDIDRLTPHLQRLERLSQHSLFRRHPLHFARRGWTVDNRGCLWGTQLRGGIWCYEWASQRLRHFTRQSHHLPSDTIRGVLTSGRHTIWLLSQHHLSQLNPSTGLIQSYPLPTPLSVDQILAQAGGTVQLYERPNGDIMWVYAHQLFRFSPATGQFQQLSLPPPTAPSLCWFATGPDGQTYLTVANKVYRYEPDHRLVVIGELASATMDTQSFLVDQAGLLWMGTNTAGIQQIDPSGLYFEVHPNQAGLFPDLFQQQWGVSLAEPFDWPATDRYFGTVSYFVRSVYDRQHRLWVGLRHRVGYIDSTQRRFVLVPPLPTGRFPLSKDWGIGGLYFDTDDRLWALNNDGNLVWLDSQHRQWVTWLSADQFRRQVDPDVYALDMVMDQRAFWITTRTHGLVRIDRSTRQIQRITQASLTAHFPTNLLLGLQNDPNQSDRLWIGSHEGLISLDKTSGQGRLFTQADGLPDNTIYSMLVDGRCLWLSTNQGLCRFDTRTRQTRTFSSTDGLPGNEFNRFHHLQLPDGRLAFGGTDGWVRFDPRTVQNDRFLPSVVLTDLKINNRATALPPNQGVLPVPINSLKTLAVSYWQNTLSLSFAGLEFNQPEKLQYRYQLEGYDDEWVAAGNTPLATYTQLPPGHYTLRVNVTNTTGQWSPRVHSLAIIVKPPWWRTDLAYILYLLSGLGLLRFYVRQQTRRERERQLRLAQQREAQQLRAVNELKTRFFANITHEFRTPITLILTPTEQLKQVLDQPEQQHRLATIDRNAHQLLTLVNQLLDLSKLEAGALPIHEAPGDLVEFVRDIVNGFDSQAQAQSIQLLFRSADNPLYYWFDTDKLERILLNLISNALKFTSAGGQITVQLEVSDQRVEITVSDTGIGMAADQLVHIFERFYQVNDSSTREHEGTGIGLALVRQLVDLQGGQITVKSQPGEGSTFSLQLPYRMVTPGPEFRVTDELPAPTELSQPAPESTVVLIVEDNRELAHFIATSLPTHYTIHQAANGEEGLEKALETMPDLIISDVLMPVMDGYTLVGKLKADWRTSHIPVIMLTAKSALDSRLQGLRLGADDYMAKPFHIQELQLRVQNKLEQSRQLRSWLQARLVQPTTERVSTEPAPIDSFLALLYQTVDQHLDDSSFGPDELIAQLKVSRMGLYRKLKALMNLSTGEFIRSYRLKRATELLQQGIPSSETAYRVGFESPAYFTKCFREAYQMTPTEFTARHKTSS